MNTRKLFALVLALALVLTLTGCDSMDYKKATSLYEEGSYAEAAELFEALGDYEDSAEQALVCRYAQAQTLYDAGDFAAAQPIFEALGAYGGADTMVTDCVYQQAEALYAAGSYEEALALYEAIPTYSDSSDKITASKKAVMFEKYGDVITLMTQGTWFFNGGTDVTLNQISFTEDAATITQYTGTGNGFARSSGTEFSYLVDAANIVLTLADGSEMTIPYQLGADRLTLGQGEYFTPREVDEGLQGFWRMRKSELLLGFMNTTNEYIIQLNNGTITYESAADAYNGAPGEYYYYGPYSGSYSVSSNGFSTDVRNGLFFGFNIIDGEVVLLRATEVCSRTDGFKGEYGFSFS